MLTEEFWAGNKTLLIFVSNNYAKYLVNILTVYMRKMTFENQYAHSNLYYNTIF